MKIRTNTFDLWVFHRHEGVPKYLLLHTSQEKANKWFGGGRFWQIPCAESKAGQALVEALRECLADFLLTPKSLWAVEHTYTIYNRRRDDLEMIPVFAAEVDHESAVPLSWEWSESGWFSAAECEGLLTFRGLREGLYWTRQYITESKQPAEEFRLL